MYIACPKTCILLLLHWITFLETLLLIVIIDNQSQYSTRAGMRVWSCKSGRGSAKIHARFMRTVFSSTPTSKKLSTPLNTPVGLVKCLTC